MIFRLYQPIKNEFHFYEILWILCIMIMHSLILFMAIRESFVLQIYENNLNISFKPHSQQTVYYNFN